MAAVTPMEVSTSQTRWSYISSDPYHSSYISTHGSGIVTSASPEPYDLITFLEVCQNLMIEFLPITWRPALDRLGIGAQSEVRQSLINIALSFAFNRVNILRDHSQEENAVYRALVSQVRILGHAKVRNHSNITNLIGVCWDVRLRENAQSHGDSRPESDVLPQDSLKTDQESLSCKWRVWPVLVYEKSQHGDLVCFMRSTSGSNLDITGRLKLCEDIGSGVRSLHENRKENHLSPSTGTDLRM